jgi:hypothetical protein
MPHKPHYPQDVARFYSKLKPHDKFIERFRTLVELSESPEHPKVIIKLDDPYVLNKFVYLTDAEGRKYFVALPIEKKLLTKHGVGKTEFYRNISSFINKLVKRESGSNVQIKNVNGGGYITTRGKRLLIGGHLEDYGEVPNEEVVKILQEAFPDLEVHYYPDEISPENYLNDREALLDIAAVSPWWLQKFPSELIINDRELILEALKREIPDYADSTLKYLPKEVRNNKEIALVAVRNNCRAIKSVSKQLKNDRDVVLAAVRGFGLALRYASEELRNDREIVLEAVRSDGEAVSERFGNDREIVLEAVRNHGDIIKYASERLKNDKEIVLEAIRSDSDAVKYIPERFRDNKEIVLEVIKANPHKTTDKYILNKYVSERLRNDPKFLKEVKEISSKK